MATLNAIEPTQAQITQFLNQKDPDKPVYMLNLLKFRDKANYHDGEDISGREAYMRYAKAFGQMVQASGTDLNVVFGGQVNGFLIGAGAGNGAEDTEWDAVAIVKYPNAGKMFEMVSSPAYRRIHKHRRAGLAGQLLIWCDDSGIF